MTRTATLEGAHEYVVNFFERTSDHQDDAANSLTVTISQFLALVSKDIRENYLDVGKDCMSDDLIRMQIKALVKCVYDLNNCLEKHKESVQ